MKRLTCLGILVAVVLSVTTAGAVIRRVPQDYPTIQAGVDAALAGDVVLVAPGTYTDLRHRPPGDTTKCVVIMKSSITLQGSGPGSTIIDAGAIPDTVGRGIYCRHITNAVIRDLTVKRAFAAVFGAGILVRDTSSVSILNCEVTANRDGGIIMLHGSGGSISSSSITNNLAKTGGGIALDDRCSPTITNCIISGNSAPSAGGIDIKGVSNPVITDCEIRNNIVTGITTSGGGLFIDTGSRPTLTRVKVLNNGPDFADPSHTGPSAGGGVFIAGESFATMNNCLIQGNATTSSSGVDGRGGGVYLDGSSLVMEDCTVARNTVRGSFGSGAGIYSFCTTNLCGIPNQTVSINQCTIAANSNANNPTDAGGITVFISNPVISKSIIAFNSPGKAMLCMDPGDNPVVSCSDLYNNAGGNTICGTDGGHNFSLDPLFCDLANNNFRINMNSPCYPGRHPDGANVCDHDRIGGQDPGCNPAGTDDPSALPAATRLIGNQPNPFRPATTISYEISRAGRVDLRIFDVAGREVRALAQGTRPAGRYEAVWDGRTTSGDLSPSGVYFYRLSVNGLEETRRMVLTR